MKTLICTPKRTPIGSFQGSLASVGAVQLGRHSLEATIKESGVDPTLIDECYMGCVLTAGLGQAPARQAAIAAGLDQSTPCTTVGKVCGSGLKSVMLADQAIRCDEAQSVLAGGMESMSQSPYLVPKIRDGLRLGHGQLVDSMIQDGLWDAYNDFHMGTAAEICNKEKKISREEQDQYAQKSYERAQKSIKEGLFKDEIAAVEIKSRKGSQTVDQDEEAFRADFSRFSSLRPVFDPAGSVTAANASTLNDGAASMLLCSEDFAKKNNLTPIAQILGQTQSAAAPEWFTTAPATSVQKLLDKAGLKTGDIDLWELNEAFATVALVNCSILELDQEKVNIRGGAIALGHPIGASGARILCTLLHSLKQEKKKLGVASLCIGGGEAVSVLVENLAL